MPERYINFMMATQVRKDFQQLINWLEFNLDDVAKAATGQQVQKLEELVNQLRSKWNSYHWGDW